MTELSASEATVRRMNRELRALSSCRKALIHATEEAALLREVCRIICEEAGYRMAWVGSAAADPGRTVTPVAWAGDEQGYLAGASITWADTPRGRGPTGRAIRTGETACVSDFATDPDAAPWREAALRRGFRSSAALPLKAGAQTFGVLCVYAAEAGAFQPEDRRLLEELAGDVAFGMTALRARTDLRRAEEALRRSEEQYRRIVETAREGIWLLDAEGRTTFVNDRLAAMLGTSVEEMMGARLEAFLDGEGQQVADQHESRLRRKDGSELWALVERTPFHDERGSLSGTLAMLTDVTERRGIEEQLRQAQKLEAVGRLAGGVAHDFNNLLTAILGDAHALVDGLEPADPRRVEAEEIVAAAQKAALLTRQLLAFGRKQRAEPRVVDVGEILASTERLLRRLIGEDVELVTDVSPGLGRVRVDPVQLEQVILNLAVNARDAMPAGGRLLIEATNEDVPRWVGTPRPGVVPGRWIALAVHDTGVGMSRDVQAHLFEPFFTTKEVGKGTGLGLATVYGIVKQAGGEVRVRSEPGKGTSVVVHLPRVEPVAEPRVPVLPAGPARGTERVLVVEDEPMVRALAVRVLRGAGYDVLEAADAEQALGLLADGRTSAIDLLLTDVVMPRVSGPQLAARLRTARPELPVLFASGYTDRGLDGEVHLGRRTGFIPKPFTPGELARRVRELLDREGGAPTGGARA